VRVRRPSVPKWVEHFAGWDGKSPGKWDAFQNKCSTSSQIRPRIRPVQLVGTGPESYIVSGCSYESCMMFPTVIHSPQQLVFEMPLIFLNKEYENIR